MNLNPYSALLARCQDFSPGGDWARTACTRGNQALENCRHGDFPAWIKNLDALPAVEPYARLEREAPKFGRTMEDQDRVRDCLMALHPWRKGPLNIAGIPIDTEWRSDWKWSRLAPHVDLSGCRVLDIGCGNGYYGWRMLGAGAELVIGIDPTLIFVMQWLACRHFSGDLPNYVLPFGIEELPDEPVAFECVFSMGVLYHRRDPMHHLSRLRALVEPGGTLVLETLVLPDSQSKDELVPQDRYARMRNVWSIPGLRRLEGWLAQAGFSELETVHVGETSPEEQRSTAWMKFESLDKALDPRNPGLTIEGYPAPRRAVIVAR